MLSQVDGARSRYVLKKQPHLGQPITARKSARTGKRRQKLLPLQVVGIPSLCRALSGEKYCRSTSSGLRATLRDPVMSGTEGNPQQLSADAALHLCKEAGSSVEDCASPNWRNGQAAARVLDTAGALLFLLTRHSVGRSGPALLGTSSDSAVCVLRELSSRRVLVPSYCLVCKT